MLEALRGAIEAHLSPDVLARTLQVGGLIFLLRMLLGVLLTATASGVTSGFASVVGDRLKAETVDRIRRSVRRGGALVTALILLETSGLVGYYVYFQQDLWAVVKSSATEERIGRTLEVVGLIAGFSIAAAFASILVTRIVAWLETKVLASGLDVTVTAVQPVAKSLSSFLKTMIFIEAILLSLQLASVSPEYVEPVKRALKLAALVLGALLLARIVHLLLDAVASFLAVAPEKGAFRYLLRLRDMISLGKRGAEYLIYAAAARSIAYVLGGVPEVDTLGSRVISTILFGLGARVVVEFVALVIHDVFIGAPADKVGVAPTTQAEARAHTLVPILRSLAQYFVYFVAAIQILKVWEVDTGPILGAAGLLGLAVGLGAQKLTGDLVAGFFILFEGTYFVGHYIVVGGTEGTVESISIRTTSIRDEKGVLHTIPNGSVNVVSNYSTGFVDAVVDVVVSAKADLEKTTASIVALGKKLVEDKSADVLAATQVEGLVDLNAADAVLRTRTRVRPGRHEWAKCELRRRLKDVFQTENVEIKALKG